MIVLSVTHYNGAPAERLEASFDELGGSIGRAPENQLVLPDPERSVSRVHAQVVFRSGAYAIVDRGSNPVSVNGRALGHGREQVLSGGDTLQIGGYTLQVRAGQAPRASSPFDDLFAPPTAAPAPPPRPAAAGAWQPPAASPAPAPPAGGFAGIPVDWDPMAPDTPDTSPQVRRPAEDPLAGLARSAPASSLDDLFGLGPAAAPASPAVQDPLALLKPAPSPGLSDPLADLLGPSPAAPAPQAAPAGELQQPWPTPPPRSPAPSSAVPAAAGASPSGAIFSWSRPAREGKVVTLPPGASTARVEIDLSTGAGPAVPAAPAPASPPTGGEAALREALLAGLGLPPGSALPLDAATLHRIGRLLREATQGSVELLQARAAVKRSVRAEMTAIVPRGNNPLKFSPSSETALLHLLGPQVPGFLDAETAMREAFDDLRAHELAVMAGMRAALDGVLQRFDPAKLEAGLEKRSGLATLGGLLAGSRKSRLWELFEQQFAAIRQEAADDFQDFFGRAFLQAYEAQLDRLAEDREREGGKHVGA